MPAPLRPYTIERTKPTVITVRMNPWKVGDEQWFLLRADAHHDNKHTRHDLERKHLEQARERNAGIFDLGDLFDAMGGRFDKRSDPSHLPDDLRAMIRKRQDQDDGCPYFDAIVDYNARFYEPYRDHFVFLARGNHETAALKKSEVDLSARLAERLGSHVVLQRYSGWVRFMFAINQTRRRSCKMFWHHGWGAGGPVGKDIASFSRLLERLGDVDIVASSHTHDALHVPIVREYLTESGVSTHKEVDCIKVGTYKNETLDGHGWAVERGHNHKPVGAWWLRFYAEGDTILHEVRRAK